MAGQTLSTLTALLKEWYAPYIVEGLNEEVPFLKLLERKQHTAIGGKEFYLPVHLKRNSGIGARPELGTLPQAGNQGYANATFTVVYNYGRVQFSGPSIAATRSDKGSFGQVQQLEMDQLKNDFRVELNWQFLRNGKAARATVASAATGQTTISVNAVFPNILQEGMLVDIYDSTLTTQKYSGLTIQSVSLDPTTWSVTSVTLSSSVTVSQGDAIVRSGNVGYEITGLDAAVGSGIYGNINPANYAMWQSPVLSNGGTQRPLTEDLFQRAVDTVKRASGGQVKYFFTTPNVRRNFFNQLSTTKRTVNTINYEGGFDSIEFAGKEIFVDDMCIPNTMYGIDPTFVMILETDSMGWMDDDGQILHRNLNDTDGVYAVMRWYSNMACTKRNALVKITDLSES